MPLVKARCTVCGANLEVEGSLKNAFCPYCGAEYDVQDAISNVTITNQYQVDHVETMTAISREKSDEMLRQAEKYLNEQNYSAAEKSFRDYAELLPGESDGWWGILRSKTQGLKNIVFSEKDLNEVLGELAERAVKTAWGEKQQAIQKGWTAYRALWQKERPRIVSETQQRIRKLTAERDAARGKEKKAGNECTQYKTARKYMEEKYSAKAPDDWAWVWAKWGVIVLAAGWLLKQLAIMILNMSGDFPISRAVMIASAVPFAVALFNLLRMLSWKKKIKAFGELAREAEQEMLAARGSADKLDRQLQKEYDLLK